MAVKPPSSTSSTPQPPQPLTFPAQIFAKLSPSAYLTAHLTTPPSLRPSRRSPSESRPPTVHTGSLTHTHGSAVVRCGDTAVVCGIRGEVLKVEDVADWESTRNLREDADEGNQDVVMEEDGSPEEANRQRRKRKQDAEEMARLNLLVPNIDLATGCSPAHLPGGPPSALAQSVTQRILSLLHTSQLLSMDDLRIYSKPPPTITSTSTTETQESQSALEELSKPELKAFWTLHISILFISLSGPPFDCAWLSLLAALSNLRLPRAWHDNDTETVLCSPIASEAQALKLYDTPVALSFAVFHGEGKERWKKWILADPDGFEEGLCREGGTVVVGEGGRVISVEICGGGGIEGKEVRGLVELAGRRREEWMRVSGGG